MTIDHQWSELIANWTKRSRLRARIAIFGASELIWLMGGMALMLAWDTGRDDSGRWTQVGALFVTVAFAYLTTLGLELLVKRRRPFQQGEGKPLIQMSILTPSFPSGHATVSFALAFAMGQFAPESAGWFFAFAALISISRVAVGVHYLTDILAGAAVGLFVSWLLL